MKVQRNTVGFEMQSVEQDDGGATIIGYGEMWGVLNDAGRVFVPGAFQDGLKQVSDAKPLPIGWMHESPIGRWTQAKEDATGLRLEGKISPTTLGQDASILLRDGAITALSIGFQPEEVLIAEPGQKVAFDTPQGRKSYKFEEYVLYVQKARLLETSLVLVGAADEARVIAVQSLVEKAHRAMPALSDASDWEDAAYAMALLMGGRGSAQFADLPDPEHYALYQRLCSKYVEHDRTPPPYERNPDYKQVAFQHGEKEVFADRYLRKSLATVVAGANGFEGQLSPETIREAHAVQSALERLTRPDQVQFAEELTQLTAELKRAVSTLKE